MSLAIDRFRASVPSGIERRAQEIADELGNPTNTNDSTLLGYLSSSVAIALERPRLLPRDRLAVDLRVVDITRERRRTHQPVEITTGAC